MAFEYDPAKSAADAAKHGLNFEQARALWQDPHGLVISARSAGEPRKLLVDAQAGRLWAAIFTQRGGNVRIISVRRARESERTAYYEH